MPRPIPSPILVRGVCPKSRLMEALTLAWALTTRIRRLVKAELTMVIFTARGYAKRGICRRRVSVCLSHSGIISKRLNVQSRKQRRTIAP